MKFLVDECCPRIVVETLRENGFDVFYVAEQVRAATDLELVKLAQTENRIIVTEDFDFGDLTVRDQHELPGLIILYLPSFAPIDRARRLVEALEKADFKPDAHLAIIEENRIRIRQLG